MVQKNKKSKYKTRKESMTRIQWTEKVNRIECIKVQKKIKVGQYPLLQYYAKCSEGKTISLPLIASLNIRKVWNNCTIHTVHTLGDANPMPGGFQSLGMRTNPKDKERSKEGKGVRLYRGIQRPEYKVEQGWKPENGERRWAWCQDRT